MAVAVAVSVGVAVDVAVGGTCVAVAVCVAVEVSVAVAVGKACVVDVGAEVAQAARVKSESSRPKIGLISTRRLSGCDLELRFNV